MQYEHKTKLTVRFGETDLLGHVNNANYFSYLEHARVQFFKDLSSDSGYQYDRNQFILATIKCDFLAQTFFDQELTIGTKVSRVGNTSFTLEQPIYDTKTGTKVARGESVIVYFDFEEQTSKPVPDALREQLDQYLEPVRG
ncbi:MAG TPA: thioesterase family protein [Bacillales bacterium]|nr:thioesterase family protein [Bacillales bacterium]